MQRLRVRSAASHTTKRGRCVNVAVARIWLSPVYDGTEVSSAKDRKKGI